MRSLFAALSLTCVVLMSLFLLGANSSSVDMIRASSPSPHVALYDPDPAHLWNRLHAALLIREDRNGNLYGEDSPDPFLWGSTKHLLEPESHRRAIRALDEFLQNHAERLIQDPVKRAVLQHDLWAVFDWSAARQPEHLGEPAYKAERHELQVRLAEVMRRVALTREQIKALPDNYAQAVASGDFAKDFNPAQPEQTFLPSGLFQQHGPWVQIQHARNELVAAPRHVSAISGRSQFLIFISMPGGRQAVYDYYQRIRQVPNPWLQQVSASGEMKLNPAIPRLPVGTTIIMMREMMLIDNQGNLVPATLTDTSILLTTTAGKTESAKTGIQYYEVRLSRRQLFAGKAGGLRAVGRQETEPVLLTAESFRGRGKVELVDEIESPILAGEGKRSVMQACTTCHVGGDDPSAFKSIGNLLKPNPLQRDSFRPLPDHWWQQDGAVQWKEHQPDWVLLRRYMREGSTAQ